MVSTRCMRGGYRVAPTPRSRPTPRPYAARVPAPDDGPAERVPPDATRSPADTRVAVIFVAFLAFGARAFGGPLVQLEGLLAEFVERRRWTGPARFRRALGVYQLLPGPEAHEMCCYLGTVRGGRLGGIAAGLGFLLPGLVLMLAASALHDALDMRSPPVAGAMAAMQIAACALILRAATKLVRPFALPPATPSATPRWPLAVVVVAAIGAILLLGSTQPGNGGTDATLVPRGAAALFGHGLVAGLVTFGGAYTALPYIASVATGDGGWMSQEACLDGIAIASVLPAPLVIFGTFVGWKGGGLAGALAFTAGIFLPAFGFTFAGFGFFERLVSWRPARTALDALGAVAVGCIVGAALFFAVETCGGWRGRPVHFGAWTPLVVVAATAIAFRFRGPFTAPILVVGAGLAGTAVGAIA
jgi:chromate transporter